MSFVGPQSRALQERAQRVLPLGTNSNFRFWGNGATPYVKRAKGAYLWDVDGKQFIDFRLAFGPIILGHAFDEVDAKVVEEIKDGVLYAMTGELEVQVAEMISEMVPAIEMVRFACSGTEATMHALRVARAYTGRELIVKFEGNYHGFQDYTLWSTYAPVEAYGSRRSPIPVAASSGIPKSMRDLVITLPFNDFEGLERVMRSFGQQIAAVITEPCQGNCGAIEPQPGFLQLDRQTLPRLRSGFYPGRDQDGLSYWERRRSGVLSPSTRPHYLCKSPGERLSYCGIRRQTRYHVGYWAGGGARRYFYEQQARSSRGIRDPEDP